MTFFSIFSRKKENDREKNKIIIDYREKNSLVAAYLMKEGFDIEFRQLAVGDYVVGDTGIERKTISDLKGSIINKRIINQLLELKQFKECFLIVEGFLEENPYDNKIIHENAFRGFLLSVFKDYGMPVIFSLNAEDSAKYISVLARRKGKKSEALRASKIFLNEEEQAQFVLEGFENIGPMRAGKLLEKFGSLKKAFNATEKELREILGKRSRSFRELLEKDFKR